MSHRTREGFTLAELIVVIAVLAILATVGLLSLSGYSQDAKDSAIKANVRSVQTAIVSESALTGNSPRFYVVHDSWAALSGAIVYVDGNSNVLTGGAWDSSGTNYSAGNPDYAKLKLNPDKFKISSFEKSFVHQNSAVAAWDQGGISVGAASVSQSSQNKRRIVSFVQTAAISPATKLAIVAGDFPTGMSWSVSGLIRNPADPSSTWALVDSAAASVTANAPSACQTPGAAAGTVKWRPALCVGSVGGKTIVTLSSDSATTVNQMNAIATCDGLGSGWRTPTENELAALWTNRAAIGGFWTTWYWSAATGRVLYFDTGVAYNATMTNSSDSWGIYRVRCVADM